jgi:hypothetical protein
MLGGADSTEGAGLEENKQLLLKELHDPWNIYLSHLLEPVAEQQRRDAERLSNWWKSEPPGLHYTPLPRDPYETGIEYYSREDQHIADLWWKAHAGWKEGGDPNGRAQEDWLQQARDMLAAQYGVVVPKEDSSFDIMLKYSPMVGLGGTGETIAVVEELAADTASESLISTGSAPVSEAPLTFIEGVVDSPRTPLHTALQQAYAEAAQESGYYQRISQGSISLSEFSGLEHSPDIKPDFMGLTYTGQIDMVEILSPSQVGYQEYLWAKLEKAMNQLPPEMRGELHVIDPAKALEGE